jgi:hypothetical protein
MVVLLVENAWQEYHLPTSETSRPLSIPGFSFPPSPDSIAMKIVGPIPNNAFLPICSRSYYAIEIRASHGRQKRLLIFGGKRVS